LFFGSNPLLSQKAYHAEYSMPSGCDRMTLREAAHFACRNVRIVNARAAAQSDPVTELRAAWRQPCHAEPDPIEGLEG
jgi:hypothetical protein